MFVLLDCSFIIFRTEGTENPVLSAKLNSPVLDEYFDSMVWYIFLHNAINSVCSGKLNLLYMNVSLNKSKRTNIADVESWKPENLFNRNDYSNLAEKIEVIAALPETGLGTDSNKAPFNPDIVAKILIAWVNGDKLNKISAQHPSFVGSDINKQITDFVTYMNGARFKASWGLSALEGIVKGVETEIKDSYVPSFVYYGVNDRKSLAIRMIGIPRSISPSLSQVIENDVSTYSFEKLRKTINELPLRDWDALKPSSSKLSGEEWKRVVSILMEGK